ncbi:MAG: outer membrane beta-barrel protein [Thiohalomonadales bacterium]
MLAGIFAIFLPVKLALAMEDPPYHLSRLGMMSIGDSTASKQQVLGVVLGLRVGFAYYLEAELNLRVGGGEYDRDGEQRKYKISNLAIYGAYRYVMWPNYYLKLKAGLAYTHTAITGNDLTNEVTSNSTGAAGGVGLGMVFSANNHPVMLELEVTTIDQGDALLYSLGITYPF